MSSPPKTEGRICHITDAGGLVHWGQVRVTRRYRSQGYVSVTVSLACVLQTTRWRADSSLDPAHLPRHFDLPKILHGGILLVKYEPRSLLAPAITCMGCVPYNPAEDC